MKLFDAIPTFPLTYGAVVFHTEHVTNLLRWPYGSESLRKTFRYIYMAQAYLEKENTTYLPASTLYQYLFIRISLCLGN